MITGEITQGILIVTLETAPRLLKNHTENPNIHTPEYLITFEKITLREFMHTYTQTQK